MNHIHMYMGKYATQDWAATWTTMSIRRQTKAKLDKHFKSKQESYDDVIDRIVTYYDDYIYIKRVAES